MFNNKVSENDKQSRKFPLLEMFLICEPITMQIWSHMTRGLFSWNFCRTVKSRVVKHGQVKNEECEVWKTRFRNDELSLFRKLKALQNLGCKVWGSRKYNCKFPNFENRWVFALDDTVSSNDFNTFPIRWRRPPANSPTCNIAKTLHTAYKWYRCVCMTLIILYNELE